MTTMMIAQLWNNDESDCNDCAANDEMRICALSKGEQWRFQLRYPKIRFLMFFTFCADEIFLQQIRTCVLVPIELTVEIHSNDTASRINLNRQR